MHPGEGDEELSEKGKKEPSANADRGKPRARQEGGDASKRSRTGDLGKALRSVYDSTLREDVPRDFIDLLGKLS